jgi:hypothetical protein
VNVYAYQAFTVLWTAFGRRSLHLKLNEFNKNPQFLVISRLTRFGVCQRALETK